ncbi:hypothetical protein CVV65_02680 [Kyrpidia spormannii]|uniref:Integral membrane protein TerC n=1 Tax=Kyrpidia spormannii TaxID=2055160 RepID=A0A2K8N5C0_9BACL|nr:hypothetical protein [Kyrpidia spormannii]ATY83997.1 hypothetical protein CVV65_02680 [Kyrpidia spormannii]
MRTIVQVFMVNLVMSVDNIIVVAGIVRRSPHLVAIAVISTFTLTAVRTGLIAGLHRLPQVPGLQLALGGMVLGIACKMTHIPGTRGGSDPPLWQLLSSVVLADLALSVDNMMVLALISKDLATIAIGTGLSLLLLLSFLPIITRTMQQIPLLQIVAAGFVALLGVRAMLQDPLVDTRLQAGLPVPGGQQDLPPAVAAALVLYGIGNMVYQRGRRR